MCCNEKGGPNIAFLETCKRQGYNSCKIISKWCGLKNSVFLKANLGPVLNLLTNFYLPSSVWRAVKRGINSKHEKKNR